MANLKALHVIVIAAMKVLGLTHLILYVIIEIKNWGTIGFCWQVNLNSTTNLKALHVIIEVKMCDNWVDPPRGH